MELIGFYVPLCKYCTSPVVVDTSVVFHQVKCENLKELLTLSKRVYCVYPEIISNLIPFTFYISILFHF